MAEAMRKITHPYAGLRGPTRAYAGQREARGSGRRAP
jgi:hypothetical protein